MMTVGGILAAIYRAGGNLLPEGETFTYEGPPGVVTPELRTAIAHHRPALLAMLRQGRQATAEDARAALATARRVASYACAECGARQQMAAGSVSGRLICGACLKAGDQAEQPDNVPTFGTRRQ